MQRQLALAAPAARHPFRRNFVQARVDAQRHKDDHDLRLFALSFTAFFICIYTFIF
ncbi:hypothetical protein GCM10009087_33490 [Sphingomonas oligophenolica]|uniref:Uncharacterized protein n=1 Tax=Sphingomonas oligophenolica TaxID=301154 RepID=A0ABU9XYM5_9SPHN